jgi:hypothetical protein
MKTALLAVLTALNIFAFGGRSSAKEVQGGPQNLKYEYIVETDLSTEKFSEAFFERLSVKHQWSRLSTTVSEDETYISVFNFKDDRQHIWECEVQIKRAESDNSKMDVVMTMIPLTES